MAVLGLHFCARAFSSCGKRGPLFIAVRGPLTIATSLVAEHRLQTRRLSNCGSRAQLLRGTWDLPRPGVEPVSPALAGRLSTAGPLGKPPLFIFKLMFFCVSIQIIYNATSSSLLIISSTMSNPPLIIYAMVFISGIRVFISRSLIGVFYFTSSMSLLNFLNISKNNPVVITVLMLLCANPNICVSTGLVLVIYLLIMHCIFQLL